MLASGLGLALFAPLGKLEPKRLLDVVRKVRRRAHAERPQDAPDLLAGMYILMGARYDEAMIQSIKQEVSEMEESITYQEILKKGKVEGKAEGRAEGRLEEALEFLIRIGSKRFGAPNTAARRKLNAINDLGRIHHLGARIDEVGSWKDLLAD